MKKQGYNDRLDDSLGSKNGKKTQSMKSRRDESEGMEKSEDKGKFSGNKSSSPTAYKKKGAAAYKKKGPMATSAERYDAKKAYDKNLSASARMHYLENDIADKKGPKAMKKEGAMAYKEGPMAMMSSFDKVHRHRRGATAMMEKGPKAMIKKKGPMAKKFDSTTDKGIKGLGSSNRSGGKYV